MIYEIATISAFIVLVLIFLSSIFLYSFCLKKEKKLNKETPVSTKKIRISLYFLVFFISLLILVKLTIFLFAADTILSFDQIAPGEINQIITHFFYTVFWIIILFSISLKKDVVDDYQIVFIRRITLACILLFFLDFLLSGTVYVMNVLHYFNIQISVLDFSIIPAPTDTTILLLIISVLLLILIGLFIAFILKRRIRILSYYELTYLLLLSGIGYFLIIDSSNLIGWNESVVYRLKLFSFEYGYVGFIFLIVLALSLVSNSLIVLLFSLKDIFVDSQMPKRKIISYLKIGFVSVIILFGLNIMPHIFIWIY